MAQPNDEMLEEERRKPLQDMDPHEGLSALSRLKPLSELPLSPDEVRDRDRNRKFWRHMFELQIAYEERGELLALAKGLMACRATRKPMPPWVAHGTVEFIGRHLPFESVDMETQRARWNAVVKARNEDNGTGKPLTWDKSWLKAEEELAGTFAACGWEHVRKMYFLVEAAGGANMTLKSFRTEKRKRARKKNKKAPANPVDPV